MPDPTTANKSLFTPLNGADVDTWDVPVNANWATLDAALGGVTSLNSTGLSGTQALVAAQYQPLRLNVTGTPIAAITYQVPSGVGGFWIFSNGTSGGQTVGISSAAGGGTITVPAGQHTIVTCDGTSAGMGHAITTTGAAAGSNTQVQYNSAGTLGASAGFTFDGTTLAATGLNVAGNTVLGATSGSTLALTGTAVAIPNDLNINGGSLFVKQSTGQLGIGIATGLTALLTVAGSIKITTGGMVFSDSTTQTTAAGPTTPAGATTQIQYNNAGAFGASASLTYDSGSTTLTVPNAAIAALTTNTTGLTQAAATNSTRLATTAYADRIGVQQTVTSQSGTISTNAATIPFDNTKPQIGEGAQYLSATITPKSTTSTLVVTVALQVSPSNSDFVTAALFRDSGADAVAAMGVFEQQNGSTEIAFSYNGSSGSTSATTFTVRAGCATWALTVNGVADGPAQRLGGIMASRITIQEIGI